MWHERGLVGEQYSKLLAGLELTKVVLQRRSLMELKMRANSTHSYSARNEVTPAKSDLDVDGEEEADAVAGHSEWHQQI